MCLFLNILRAVTTPIAQTVNNDGPLAVLHREAISHHVSTVRNAVEYLAFSTWSADKAIALSYISAKGGGILILAASEGLGSQGSLVIVDETVPSHYIDVAPWSWFDGH
ncbi:MAG: hypothetical protein ACYC4N_12680 [Pirellulaceae bacterium]